MAYKNIELDQIQYSKLNELTNCSNYENKELIVFLANFAFEIFESSENQQVILLEEDLEDLYFGILRFIKESNYTVPKTTMQIARSEKFLKSIEVYFEENIDKLSDKEIKDVKEEQFKRCNELLFEIFDFRARTMDGVVFNKFKIGYYIFLEFKRKYKSKDLHNGIENSEIELDINIGKFTTPEKIALIQLLQLEEKIDIVTSNVSEEKYRLLGVLFGVSEKTIKEIYVDNKVVGTHKTKANNFINKKFKF